MARILISNVLERFQASLRSIHATKTQELLPAVRVNGINQTNHCKTAEDGEGNVDKTIRLIYSSNTKSAREYGNKADNCASCAQMRLQLLHFHAVFKTRSTFQEPANVSFRRRRWRQRNFSESINENYEEIVLSPPDVAVLVCLGSYCRETNEPSRVQTMP